MFACTWVDYYEITASGSKSLCCGQLRAEGRKGRNAPTLNGRSRPYRKTDIAYMEGRFSPLVMFSGLPHCSNSPFQRRKPRHILYTLGSESSPLLSGTPRTHALPAVNKSSSPPLPSMMPLIYPLLAALPYPAQAPLTGGCQHPPFAPDRRRKESWHWPSPWQPTSATRRGRRAPASPTD